MYGSFRSLVEMVREPDIGREQFGLLTRGQAYSIPMLIVGIALIIWAVRRPAPAPVWPKEDIKDAKDA